MIASAAGAPDAGRPDASIAGHVRGAESGKPLADVEIAVDAFGGKPVRSDAEGAFRVEAVAAGMHALLARAAGRLPGRLEALSFVAGERHEIDLALSPAFSVEGRVSGIDGAPLDGVTVAARATEEATLQLARARTGADGRFRLDGLPRGLAWLEVSDARGRAGLRVLVPSALVEVALTRACTLDGEVLSVGGEAPAAGIEVALQYESGRVQRAKPPEDGRFSFSEIGGGMVELTARAAGARAFELVHARPGRCAPSVRMQLRPAGPVQGVVTAAEDGSPIPEARIQHATRWHAVVVGEEAGVTTDSAGHFLLDGVFAARWLRVTAPGFAARFHQVPTRWKQPGAPQINFKLYRQLWIRGRVQGGDGAPVPSFQLCDEYLGERRTLEECQSVSAADGSFEVHRDDPRSPPSRHGFKARLAIVSHGFALAVSSLGKAGEPWDLDQVVLSPEGPLTVRVVDPSGRPVAGARIEQGEAGISWDWVGDTDGAGLARAWPLDEPTRPTCFRAVHPLFPTTRVGECLYAGGKARAQLSIALPPACWVGGRVLKDGAPVASATVVDLKHEGLSAVTGADGRYRLGPLEEGAHAPALRRALPAKQEGAPVDGVEAAERIERASIDLRAGEEKTVDLQAQ